MKNIKAIYSPICEVSIAFLHQLNEWFENTDVCVESASFNNKSEAQKELYIKNGILVSGRMLESCFIDVFYQGKLINSIPLNMNKICSALGLVPASRVKEKPYYIDVDTNAAQKVRSIINDNNIQWLPITSKTAADEMTMCLHNHPHGNPPKQFHKNCIDAKMSIFNMAWEMENCAGIYAKYNDKVIGLLEVFPREILRKYGFVTGNTGNDSEYLTIGCYEVAIGMPRLEIIDELLRRLEMNCNLFKRNRIEGIGVFERPDGFTPYWVYDKYGFKRTETITEYKVVMMKKINSVL
jgi:hypothetical protein